MLSLIPAVHIPTLLNLSYSTRSLFIIVHLMKYSEKEQLDHGKKTK